MGLRPRCTGALLLLATCAAQAAPPEHYGVLPRYKRRDVMIPMRDGVHLHAAILRPTHARGKLPFLLTRTPYGVEGATAQAFPRENAELAKSGYIFVEEDIRGRYRSEGTFVMMRPLAAHHDARQYPREVDESTDAFDTVAWLRRHVHGNNGRAGVFGVSYPGFLAMEAGIDPNPAVKAISPQAPMTDVWLGDDFFHNGAFRESYGYDYGLGMETSRTNSFGSMPPGTDAYDFFLKAGNFANAIAASGTADLPTWQAFLLHPAYDAYWQARAVEPHLQTPAVPTLEVGGYWDQEDMWGPQQQYANLHAEDPDGRVRLVLGPWNHGEWRGEASTIGDLDWGQPTGTEFQREMEAPFFAHYLKDEPLDLSNTTSFQTGTDHWMHYRSWPPASSHPPRPLYLNTGASLTWAAPSVHDATGTSAYVSDPARPMPYRARPVEATYAPRGSHWYTWLAEDQRPYTSRADQLTWRMEPLLQPLTVTGNVQVDLWAATTGSDADWIVKLIDEYPTDRALGKLSGYQLMIAEEIFRGRYQQGFSMAHPIAPNQPLEYRWSLHAVDHAFLPGHRLLVQVQSSWFPLYDRNPQTFVSNIMTAPQSSFQAETEHIYFSTAHPSRVLLPLAPEHAGETSQADAAH